MCIEHIDRKSTKKKMEVLNNATNQLDVITFIKYSIPKRTEDTIFSNALEIFFSIVYRP